MTCIPANGVRNGRKTLCLCGNYEDERDLAPHADDATCPDCRAEWQRERGDMRTAEDVFGTEDEIRAFGPSVRAHHQ